MTSRREFLQNSLVATGALALPRTVLGTDSAAAAGAAPRRARGVRVVSTWEFGVGANAAAWPVLARGGSALNAVEAGARWAEGNLCNSTVGHCGYPDRDGVLTLDTSIMDGDGTAAAVAAIEDIEHQRPAASRKLQVCFLANNRDGEVGAYALHPGFVYAVHDGTPGPHDELIESSSIYGSNGE
jgi:N4-(beta-N-acetylglucosaminyl)-L-asparaginase